jgi:hypothetical protein
MKERYRLFIRRKGVYYAFDNTTKTNRQGRDHAPFAGAQRGCANQPRDQRGECLGWTVHLSRNVALQTGQ